MTGAITTGHPCRVGIRAGESTAGVVMRVLVESLTLVNMYSNTSQSVAKLKPIFCCERSFNIANRLID